MFCPKCGTKALDDATFCQKCGAKLNGSDVVQQASTAMPVQQMPPQIQNIPSDIPNKKKLGKLPIILGAAVLVIILIVVVASMGNNSQQTQSSSNTGGVNLSETYTNEAEGIAFKYPSAWKPIDAGEIKNYYTEAESENIVVFLANETKDASELNSYIEVLKFPSSQADIDHLWITDEEFKATFAEDVSITKTSVIQLDGVPTRMIAFATSEDIIYRSYFYGVDSNLYRVNFIRKGKVSANDERFFDAIIESYTIATDDKSGGKDVESLNTADVNYEGVSLSQLLHLPADEVIALLGPPVIHDEYKLAYETIEFALDGGRITHAESFNPEKFILGGTPLAQNRSLLPALLGEPTHEGESGSGYEMTFEQNAYALTIATGDKDGVAWRIFMSPNIENGTKSPSVDEMLYKGQPILPLLDSTPEELNKIFGAPTGGTPVTGELLYGATEYYTYDGISFMLGDQGSIFNITVSADAVEVNGTALNQNRTGIINMLGTPGYEEQLPEDESGEGLGGYYIMEYTSYEDLTIITVQMPDADSKANNIIISRYDDGPGDEEYQEQSNNIDSSSPLTADGNTLSVGSLVYAKQNVFGVSVNYVRGYVTATDNAGSVSVQWDTLLENRLWAYDECAILSDSNSPSGYSYYSNASGKQIPLAGVKFNLSANELYSKIP